ncbi:TlpA disulfide reductase family protein [Dichotomicrobium thermohalophilum]|uniref:Thiol-disulfide isomerase/thioredoxin n=1 Tax=Dichotomicrobium thermohalophilum TaxID=933063 RepID=A0A397Q587_9HYPH|nr:TlpA disulfide reductase family protein [Dichotomicrobium thermohalophilum]RIA55589.1 thiol-disulfide isomerase/thioredoxin [Dichotomicrobium thermohalophilum]
MPAPYRHALWLAAALLSASLLAPTLLAAAENDPPALVGHSGQFTVVQPPEVPAPVPFENGLGEAVTLEDFRGRVVLLNFWATWCAPCVQEMPWLDQLARDMADQPFNVIAISLDEAGRRKVIPFYQRHGIETLEVYTDPDQRVGAINPPAGVSAPFSLYGMPTTYVIGKNGAVRGYIQGAVDWRSNEARALLDYYLAQS